MPVPKKSAAVTSDRKLLREVVLDQLLAAIHDGTLVPGETLRDDELAAWLGVSRTPIREAITRLNEMGLVDMAPNRYTRISQPDAEKLGYSMQVVGGLNELAVRRAVPLLDDKAADEADSLIADTISAFQSHEHGAAAILNQVTDFFISRCENPVLEQTVKNLNAQVTFMLMYEEAHFQWDLMVSVFTTLRRAVARRDADAAAGAMRLMTEDVSEQFLNEVRNAANAPSD